MKEFNKIYYRKCSSKVVLVITITGSLLIIFSIVYSYVELKSLEEQITVKQNQLNSLLKEKKDIQTRLEELKKQINNSREAVYYVTQGINRFHLGLYAKAIESYNKALRLDSLNTYVLNLKGYSLFKAKKYDEAINTLEKAININPTYTWAYFDLARVYCRKKKYRKALVVLKKMLNLDPDMISVIKNDYEFQRLCKPIITELYKE